MLGQSLGSMILTWEAMNLLIPNLFIGQSRLPFPPQTDDRVDTMGYAFSYPVVKALAGIPIGSYIHYPTISPDMLQRVRSRAAGHTNTSSVSSSTLLSTSKLLFVLPSFSSTPLIKVQVLPHLQNALRGMSGTK